MDECTLAEQLLPQLKQIAEMKGLARVTRVEMTIGALHGVAADPLAESLLAAFRGSNFAGAKTRVTVVAVGEAFTPPGADEPVTANGFEIFVTRIEGL